jgi:hypothetical protein
MLIFRSMDFSHPISTQMRLERADMKSSAFKKKRTLAMLMIVQLFCVPTEGLSQSSGFGITPIVRRGDPVSDGGRFFDCDDCEGRVVRTART